MMVGNILGSIMNNRNDLVDRSVDCANISTEIDTIEVIPKESLILRHKDQKLSKVVINREELF